MPERVPTKLCLNSEFASRWSQVFVQNRLSPVRLLSMAMPARKNPIFWLAIKGLFFPPDERFAHQGMDRYWLLRGFRFARSHETMDDGARHVHRSRGKIDIAPFQREQFALPNAG